MQAIMKLNRLVAGVALLVTGCTAPTSPTVGAARSAAVKPVPTANPDPADQPDQPDQPDQANQAAEPPAVAGPVKSAPALLPAIASGPPLRPFTNIHLDDTLAPQIRARQARTKTLAVIEELFRQAEVSFPPAGLLLRGYKHEQELEVWASSERDSELRHITTYSICATSGELGPKRREGDLQVPEGYYRIQYLWPGSAYYLSMKVNYPNQSDRLLGDKRWPGSDIMIHGSCASIGCLAMSDERIEEIYTLSAAAQRRGPLHVHLYPMRDQSALETLAQFGQHRDFWNNLYDGRRLVDQTKRIPTVRVGSDGVYQYSLGR